eukprot:TRINITY_DN172_c0_g1_i1.p1 TRINITY_DN172_c0_g1~~TRINITY_DN172_c0_g1_i1.p1  ORF type:complete len:346 (-),score=95.18 TRINITY_DN172_c0_g1_i1:18-1055(-)
MWRARASLFSSSSSSLFSFQGSPFRISPQSCAMSTSSSSSSGAPDKPKDPVLSATVIICKEFEDHSYKVLFVKRHAKARFMANFHVFPGGLLEKSDFDARWKTHLSTPAIDQLITDDKERALRIAAVREVFEESNVLLADPIDEGGQVTQSSELEKWRTTVQKDSTQFYEMCQQQRVRPSIDQCIPWTHWITPKEEPYRYDTFFFLMLVNADKALESRHDNMEVTLHEWLSPTEVIEKYGRKEIKLAPPTLIILSELATLFPSTVELRRPHKRDMGPVMPSLKVLDGQVAICFPGDEDNELFSLGKGIKRRLLLDKGGSRFELSEAIADPIWVSRPSLTKPSASL